MIAFHSVQPPPPIHFAEPSAVQSAAARLEPKLRRAFLQAVAGLGEGAALAKLEAALSSGNAEAAIKLLGFKSFAVNLTDALKPVLLDGMTAGATVAAKDLAARFDLRFDITNPRAVKWAETRSARLVTQVSDSTKDAIRSIVTRGQRDGITPHEQAKAIKQIVGLDERRANAVENYRRGLVERELKPSRIDELVSRYSDKQLRARANIIAITETKDSANAGLLEGWRQSVDNGFLPGTARKKWITSGGGCPAICAPIDGEEVGLDEDFSIGADAPTAHPGCACDMVLVFD